MDQGTQEHYCNTEYLDEDLNENVDLEGTEYVELPDANLVEYHIEDVNVFPAFPPYDEPRDGQRAYHEYSAELLLNSEECVDVDSTELTEPFLDTKEPEVSCTEMIQQCALFGGNINGALNGTSCESSAITLIRQNLKQERDKDSRLQSELRQVKERFRACQRKCQRRLLTIQSLRRKIGGLSDQLKKVRKESQVDRSVLTRLENNPTIQNSLRNSAKKPRGRRYNPELRKFALSSYLCGPRVYRMMRKSRVVCLPGKRTIKRWTEDVQIGPGLNEAILEQIKAKVTNFSEQERVVMIAIDGMKIKSGLSYNAKSDKFYGFPNDGCDRKIEKNSTQNLATEAVTVMVKGVYGKFKQVK